MSVRAGQDWGEPATGPPDVELTGDDAALAAAVLTATAGADEPPLVQLQPTTSDLARAVGLGAEGPTTATALPLDALDVEPEGDAPTLAVNAVVLGRAPGALRRTDRRRTVRVDVDGRTVHDGPATTVLIASGQYVGGLDVVPRGHPGDGRLEIQVYALAPGERAAMRRRLPRGAHLPHPRIITASGRRVEVRSEAAWPMAVDGRATGEHRRVRIEVRPGAFRLLV